MKKSLFGDMFDFDDDGELDEVEQAAEMLYLESFDEEDGEDESDEDEDYLDSDELWDEEDDDYDDDDDYDSIDDGWDDQHFGVKATGERPSVKQEQYRHSISEDHMQAQATLEEIDRSAW